MLITRCLSRVFLLATLAIGTMRCGACRCTGPSWPVLARGPTVHGPSELCWPEATCSVDLSGRKCLKFMAAVGEHACLVALHAGTPALQQLLETGAAFGSSVAEKRSGGGLRASQSSSLPPFSASVLPCSHRKAVGNRPVLILNVPHCPNSGQ